MTGKKRTKNTPKRTSTRKRKRSTKSIYHNLLHFVETNVDSTPDSVEYDKSTHSHVDSVGICEPSGNEGTVNQNALAECSHLNLIEIPEKCDSRSTSASPNTEGDLWYYMKQLPWL